jgi:hypothetical protein
MKLLAAQMIDHFFRMRTAKAARARIADDGFAPTLASMKIALKMSNKFLQVGSEEGTDITLEYSKNRRSNSNSCLIWLLAFLARILLLWSSTGITILPLSSSHPTPHFVENTNKSVRRSRKPEQAVALSKSKQSKIKTRIYADHVFNQYHVFNDHVVLRCRDHVVLHV